MDFNKVIKTRTSIRNFSSKKVNYEKVIDAIESANLAPSPGNLSILKYIIIDNPETIQKIAQACQQKFITKAQYIIAVCSDSKQTKIMFDTRTKKYIRQHSGAAIENFLLKITDMGLASCWVGAYSDITIKRILKIPDEIEVEAILPIAHKSKIKTKQKPKSNLNNLIYFDVWKNKTKEKPRMIGGH